MIGRSVQEERDLSIIRLEQIEIVSCSVNNSMNQVRLFLKKGLIRYSLSMELVRISAEKSIEITIPSGYHNKFSVLRKMVVKGKGGINSESLHDGKTGSIRIGKIFVLKSFQNLYSPVLILHGNSVQKD